MKRLKNGVVNLEEVIMTMKADRELEIQENVVISYRNKSKQNWKRGNSNKTETATFISEFDDFKFTCNGFENQITAIQNEDIIRENHYEWYMLWPNKDKQDSILKRNRSQQNQKKTEDDWDIVRSTYERLIERPCKNKPFHMRKKLS